VEGRPPERCRGRRTGWRRAQLQHHVIKGAGRRRWRQLIGTGAAFPALSRSHPGLLERRGWPEKTLVDDRDCCSLVDNSCSHGWGCHIVGIACVMGCDSCKI